MKRRKFHTAEKRVSVKLDHYESLLLHLALRDARSKKKDITEEQVVKGAVRLSLEEIYGREAEEIMKRSMEDLDKTLTRIEKGME